MKTEKEQDRIAEIIKKAMDKRGKQITKGNYNTDDTDDLDEESENEVAIATDSEILVYLQGLEEDVNKAPKGELNAEWEGYIKDDLLIALGALDYYEKNADLSEEEQTLINQLKMKISELVQRAILAQKEKKENKVQVETEKEEVKNETENKTVQANDNTEKKQSGPARITPPVPPRKLTLEQELTTALKKEKSPTIGFSRASYVAAVLKKAYEKGGAPGLENLLKKGLKINGPEKLHYLFSNDVYKQLEKQVTTGVFSKTVNSPILNSYDSLRKELCPHDLLVKNAAAQIELKFNDKKDYNKAMKTFIKESKDLPPQSKRIKKEAMNSLIDSGTLILNGAQKALYENAFKNVEIKKTVENTNTTSNESLGVTTKVPYDDLSEYFSGQFTPNGPKPAVSGEAMFSVPKTGGEFITKRDGENTLLTVKKPTTRENVGALEAGIRKTVEKWPNAEFMVTKQSEYDLLIKAGVKTPATIINAATGKPFESATKVQPTITLDLPESGEKKTLTLK
jgi:hypothetical protein